MQKVIEHRSPAPDFRPHRYTLQHALVVMSYTNAESPAEVAAFQAHILASHYPRVGRDIFMLYTPSRQALARAIDSLRELLPHGVHMQVIELTSAQIENCVYYSRNGGATAWPFP